MPTGSTPPRRYDLDGENYARWREAELDPSQYAPIFAAIPHPCRLSFDVGCGAGTFLGWLAGASDRVVGFDLSMGMLAHSRRRLAADGIANVSLVAADALQPPFRPGRAEFVISVNLLHRTPLDESLPRLAELVRPDGCLAIRDLVAVRPRLERQLWYRVLAGIRRTVRALIAGGPAHGAAAARFLLTRRALNSITPNLLTARQFDAICSRSLPGAHTEQSVPGTVSVVWTRPPAGA